MRRAWRKAAGYRPPEQLWSEGVSAAARHRADLPSSDAGDAGIVAVGRRVGARRRDARSGHAERSFGLFVRYSGITKRVPKFITEGLV